MPAKKRLNIHYLITQVDNGHVVQGQDEAIFTGSDSEEKAISFVEEKTAEKIADYKSADK